MQGNLTSHHQGDLDVKIPYENPPIFLIEADGYHASHPRDPSSPASARSNHENVNPTFTTTASSSSTRTDPLSPARSSASLSRHRDSQVDSAIVDEAISNLECDCIKCVIKHWKALSSRYGKFAEGQPCFFYSCDKETFGLFRDWKKHFRSHFKPDKKYACPAPNCKTVFNRFAELERHSTTHCRKPREFPCPEVGCTRSGQNGFPRKDKLKSHMSNMHKGQAAPDQLMRRLAPKPAILEGKGKEKMVFGTDGSSSVSGSQI